MLLAAGSHAVFDWIALGVFLLAGVVLCYWVFLRIGVVTWTPFGRKRD